MRRVWIGAGAVLVTAVLLGAVLLLGDWAYRRREATLHAGRLQRLVEQEPTPTLDRVHAGLLAEPGTRALPTPAGEDALRGALRPAKPVEVEAVMARARKHPTVRLYAVGGVRYVLFFDAEQKLRDFVVVG
jgi:hypothetical protein